MKPFAQHLLTINKPQHPQKKNSVRYDPCDKIKLVFDFSQPLQLVSFKIYLSKLKHFLLYLRGIYRLEPDFSDDIVFQLT